MACFIVSHYACVVAVFFFCIDFQLNRERVMYEEVKSWKGSDTIVQVFLLILHNIATYEQFALFVYPDLQQ